MDFFPHIVDKTEVPFLPNITTPFTKLLANSVIDTSISMPFVQL